ncbi:MAG: Gfo/Idh/MocA family oxidoreductase [Bacteroidales bacterium]|nr:Gfo/Idh/MocA family oxidoreductase [Bacteroidales bacterium]
MTLNRRKFIRNSAITTAGIGWASNAFTREFTKAASPSDKINIALIGCRNMGFGILQRSLEFDDVNCVALCDIDENVLNDRANQVKEKYNFKPKLYRDFRNMLEQKDIDAVIIGTPDHWHCLNFIYSLQAGKDVYVEKPMANTIGEVNLMTKAAAYYGKVVQIGQQQRSGSTFLESMKILKSGKIGNLRKVNIWANFNYGIGPMPVEDEPVPQGVDYDMWLGPAPKRPFNRNRFHGSWRHYWDYGGGLMSDWGVHLLDMGLWAKDLVKAPEVTSVYAANLTTEKRQRDTFDTMTVNFPKEDYVINFDLTAGVQQGPWEKLYGTAFIGEKGTIVTDRQSYHVYPEWDNEKKEFRTEEVKFEEGGETHNFHVRNFLDCIKSRGKTACPPEIGRAAALHAHIPNIAARVGERVLLWDDERSRFTNSEKANALITPEYRAPWTLPVFG